MNQLPVRRYAVPYLLIALLFGLASTSVAAAPKRKSVSLTISTTTLPAGTLGSTYSATLSATGGVSPYTWSATGLPAGLSISAAGTISGTPTTAGTQTASLTVKDASGTTASSSLSVTIGTQAVSVSISPTTATVSADQSQAFTASVTGTTNTGVNWYVSGVQGGDTTSGTISNGVSISELTNTAPQWPFGPGRNSVRCGIN